MKKVAIVGTVGIPAKYGGFETLAENLVKQLQNKYKFIVYCSGSSYPSSIRKNYYLGAKLKYFPFNANGRSSIIYDVFSIIHAGFYADIILILGVSGAFMIPIVRFFTKKKIITNIDGLEWKRDKWGKFAKKYLKRQERIAVFKSHHTVVDNKGIENHVWKEYNRSSSLIAYGADHVFHENLSLSTKEEYNVPKNFAFKVCRIEPENNIHIILEAFCNSTFNLIIVGNWSNSEYGKKLRLKYTEFENLFLLGPIYNQKKLNELRSNCTFYVHGHSAGGTNPSLVEAMYLGLPIVAYDVDYNRYTTNNQALYFKTDRDLIGILNDNVTDFRQLNDIGEKMKNLSKQNYTWKAISQHYERIFGG